MTQPGGGHGNDINLAALWIPVMPETSHMGDEMKKAGAESKRKFEEGFNSGSSPESMGQSFGSRLQGAIGKEFKNFEIPFGGSAVLDRLSSDIDEKLVKKLRGDATQALQSYRSEWDNLTAAQQRSADADGRIASARKVSFDAMDLGKQKQLVDQYGSEAAAMEHVNTKASIMLPLIAEQSAAHNNLTEATTKATAAHNNYTVAAGRLSEASDEAGRGSQMLAGIMGGAVVLGAQLAVTGIENLVEAIAEGFEKAIEITKELAVQAVELGEKYEQIGIQIHEFSSASGEDFEHMEAAAQRVFGQLDVAGKDVGKTMAQFSSILGTSGESVADLTRHTAELQGRYTSLKAADLGAIFTAFKTPVEQADSALATMLERSRGAGQDLGQLASALSGPVAETLHEANLSLGQASEFTGKMMEIGAPGRQVMTGLSTAMKEFGKDGLSFADGIKLTGETLQKLGDTAEGQDLAEKLFGTRNWIVAKQAVADLLDIINQGPNAFEANTSSMDTFIDKTAQLSNKIEEFKHKAEEAFKPFGDAAKDAALSGLNIISNWFTTHHHEIIDDVKMWGDKLIEFLPTLKGWAVAAIDVFGLFAEAFSITMLPIVDPLAIIGAGMLAMTGHFKEAGQMLDAVGKFNIAAISGDIGKTIGEFGNKIQDIDLHTQSILDGWNGIADAANRIPPMAGTALGQNPSGAPDVHGAPAAPGGGPTVAPGVVAPWFPTPGARGGVSPGTPTTVPLQGAPGVPGPGIQKAAAANIYNAARAAGYSEQTALTLVAAAMYESSLSPDVTNASGHHGLFQESKDKPSSGMVEQVQWAIAAMNVLGGPGVIDQNPAQWIADKVEIGGYSGSNYDVSAARNLLGMQHGGLAIDRWNPPVIDPGNPIQPGDYANLNEYLMAVNLANYMGAILSAHQGHQTGGGADRFVTGGKGGVDDIPALLTRGEYVWDTDTVDQHGWLIKALHQGGAKGFDQGGSAGITSIDAAILAGVPSGHYADPGEERDNLAKGMADCSSAIEALVNHLQGGSLTAPSGMYTGDEASWLLSHGFVPGEGGIGDFRVGFNSHHTQATLPGGTPFNWGSEEAAQNRGIGGTGADDPSFTQHYYMPFRQGSDPSQFPGMPGQYGGYGAYGGETADQQRAAAKAVQEAHDRADDLAHEVEKAQKRIDDLQAEIADVGKPKPGLLPGTTQALTPAEQDAADKKRKSLQDQLDEATHDLGVKRREAAEQVDNISDAERKQQESALKVPKSAKSTRKAPGESEFSQLGAGLLSGIGQELGFGDIFSKPPWEWGAIKLLTGAAGWAIGTANAWADQIGAGKTGIGGPGWGNNTGVGMPGYQDAGGSILSGLAGSVGINLPVPKSVSSGPNVNVNPQATQHGSGQGQPPGPVNIDNSINVSSDVSDTKVLAPIQELQNSQNSSLFTFSGGPQG